MAEFEVLKAIVDLSQIDSARAAFKALAAEIPKASKAADDFNASTNKVASSVPKATQSTSLLDDALARITGKVPGLSQALDIANKVTKSLGTTNTATAASTDTLTGATLTAAGAELAAASAAKKLAADTAAAAAAANVATVAVDGLATANVELAAAETVAAKAGGGLLTGALALLLTPVGLLVTALALCGMAATKLGMDAIHTADELKLMSDQTGQSVGYLQVLSEVAKENGTDLETLYKGLDKISKNMATIWDPTSKTSKALKTLGIDARDANGHIKDSGTIAAEAAIKIDLNGRTNEKVAAYQDLAGRSAMKLVPAYKDMAKAAEIATLQLSQGAVISKELAKASDDLGDNTDKLGISFQGAGVEIANSLAPALDGMILAFRNSAENGGALSIVLKAIVLVGQTLAAALDIAVVAFTAIDVTVQVTIDLFELLGKVIYHSMTFDFKAAAKDVDDYVKDVTKSIAKGNEAMNALTPAAKGTAEDQKAAKAGKSTDFTTGEKSDQDLVGLINTQTKALQSQEEAQRGVNGQQTISHSLALQADFDAGKYADASSTYRAQAVLAASALDEQENKQRALNKAKADAKKLASEEKRDNKAPKLNGIDREITSQMQAIAGLQAANEKYGSSLADIQLAEFDAGVSAGKYAAQKDAAGKVIVAAATAAQIAEARSLTYEKAVAEERKHQLDADAQADVQIRDNLLTEQMRVKNAQLAIEYSKKLGATTADLTLAQDASNLSLLQEQLIYEQHLNPANLDRIRNLTTEITLLKQRQSSDVVLKSQEDESRTFASGWQNAFKIYTDNANNAAGQAQTIFNGLTTSMSDGLMSFCTTGKANFKDFAKEIIAQLLRIAIARALAGIFGAPSSGASAGEFTNSSAMAGSGLGGGGFSFAGSANGNVFNSPSLSAYSNSVVDKPTFFAKGGNVMGEAGPEAIMPLQRGPDGKLGVRGSGGGGVNFSTQNSITVSIGSVDSNERASELQRQIYETVVGVTKQTIAEQMRYGNMLASAR